MRLRSIVLLTACIWLGLLRGEAHADFDHDAGLWLMAFAQGDLAPVDEDLSAWKWWFDLQPRFTDEANGLGQLLIRPGVGYGLADDVAAWLGYAWIQTDVGSRNSYEHRIWQQLTWTPDVGALSLLSRTRLEQRFLSTGSETGWRARQFVKATLPFASGSPGFFSVYDELFFDLNDTRWGQDAGISQNRLFAGVGWRLGDGPASVEVGYLNQFIDRSSRDDAMNHILSLNLMLGF